MGWDTSSQQGIHYNGVMMYVSGSYILIGIDISVTPAVQQSIDVSRLPGPQQGLKKL